MLSTSTERGVPILKVVQGSGNGPATLCYVLSLFQIKGKYMYTSCVKNILYLAASAKRSRRWENIVYCSHLLM